MIDNKNILITGGTGSFGKKFTQTVFEKYSPKKLIIFSRDEFKQYEMQKIFPTTKYPIRYFLGDIRDKKRLTRAFQNVDYVIHAAALKQVPALEYNPFEAVKTNILGAQNIIEAALESSVKKVVALSTDKSVNPINLYGATKMAMEKLIVAANAYVGEKDKSFCCVRYGNVVGSRGSVIPFFAKLAKDGVRELPVTDDKMTRFWITLDKGVELVLSALTNAQGGEIFIPKIPSMKITDLVKVFSNNGSYKVVGIRPGEKIHETLVHIDEGRNTYSYDGYYTILPQFTFTDKHFLTNKEENKVPENFIYSSNTNDEWLTIPQMKDMIHKLGIL